MISLQAIQGRAAECHKISLRLIGMANSISPDENPIYKYKYLNEATFYQIESAVFYKISRQLAGIEL